MSHRPSRNCKRPRSYDERAEPEIFEELPPEQLKESDGLEPKRPKADDENSGAKRTSTVSVDCFFEILWPKFEQNGWRLEKGRRETDVYFFPKGVTRGKGVRCRVHFYDSIKQVIAFAKEHSDIYGSALEAMEKTGTERRMQNQARQGKGRFRQTGYSHRPSRVGEGYQAVIPSSAATSAEVTTPAAEGMWTLVPTDVLVKEQATSTEKRDHGWTEAETEAFLKSLTEHGRNFAQVAKDISSKSLKATMAYYFDFFKYSADYKHWKLAFLLANNDAADLSDWYVAEFHPDGAHRCAVIGQFGHSPVRRTDH